jgi:hypothetical protein
MSNTKPWRAKQRTPKPSSRQKRNGLLLDRHPTCRCGSPATEAHHDLPKGHPQRNDPQHMRAVCRQCHVDIHRMVKAPIQLPLPPSP